MKMAEKLKSDRISLPSLRGRIGDWYYYVTILSFKDIANRVLLPKEIDKYQHEDHQLGEWIQRELQEKRIKMIVDYLKTQKQRFFNSLILGIYGGSPYWQDLKIKHGESQLALNEEELEYIGSTLGILTLNGDESIFAIDGQHRAIGIREALKGDSKLINEEVACIFVAHKISEDGKIRTRRLFSTLNRYAKPVSKKEIIILSEDDNCAIITRALIENFVLLKDKILIHSTRMINPKNTYAFTNIIVLYDIVVRMLTNQKVVSMRVNGYDYNKFTSVREDEAVIDKNLQYMKSIFRQIINKVPSYKIFFNAGKVDRTRKVSSLLFRPIGQNILFDVLKVAINNNKKKQALEYFAKDDFNLNNPIWKKIFWDEETESLFTDKSKQRFATLLILENIGVSIKRSKKDQEVYDNYNISPSQL